MIDPKAIEEERQRIWESAPLRDDIDDDAASELLKWGEQQVQRLAQSEPADFEQQARYLRQLLKSINRFAGQREFMDDAQLQEALDRVQQWADALQYPSSRQVMAQSLPDDKTDLSANVRAVVQSLSGQASASSTASNQPVQASTQSVAQASAQSVAQASAQSVAQASAQSVDGPASPSPSAASHSTASPSAASPSTGDIAADTVTEQSMPSTEASAVTGTEQAQSRASLSRVYSSPQTFSQTHLQTQPIEENTTMTDSHRNPADTPDEVAEELTGGARYGSNAPDVSDNERGDTYEEAAEKALGLGAEAGRDSVRREVEMFTDEDDSPAAGSNAPKVVGDDDGPRQSWRHQVDELREQVREAGAEEAEEEVRIFTDDDEAYPDNPPPSNAPDITQDEATETRPYRTDDDE